MLGTARDQKTSSSSETLSKFHRQGFFALLHTVRLGLLLLSDSYTRTKMSHPLCSKALIAGLTHLRCFGYLSRRPGRWGVSLSKDVRCSGTQ